MYIQRVTLAFKVMSFLNHDLCYFEKNSNISEQHYVQDNIYSSKFKFYDFKITI